MCLGGTWEGTKGKTQGDEKKRGKGWGTRGGGNRCRIGGGGMGYQGEGKGGRGKKWNGERGKCEGVAAGCHKKLGNGLRMLKEKGGRKGWGEYTESYELRAKGP